MYPFSRLSIFRAARALATPALVVLLTLVAVARVGATTGSDQTSARPPANQVPSDDPHQWKLSVRPESPDSVPGDARVRWRTPRWAPDGRRIAVNSSSGLHILDPAAPAPLLVGRDVWQFRWSPDGRTIAYIPRQSSSPARRSAVKLYRCDTRGTSTVAEGPGVRFANLTWTRSGDLAFSDVGGLKPGEPPEIRIVHPTEAPPGVPDAPSPASPLPGDSFTWLDHLSGGTPLLWTGTFGSLRPMRVPMHGPAEDVVDCPGSDHFAVLTISDTAMKYVIMKRTGEVMTAALPGNFMASDWSSDGRFLVGYETEEDPASDGRVISSDIWVWDMDRLEAVQLTTTADVFETDPAWNPRFPELAYIDSVTGRLLIARITAKRR